MLVRALLVVENSDLESRLSRIFDPLEAAIATAPQQAVLWDRVKAFPADLVVISRAALPDPIEATVKSIQDLPERPEVIVVSNSEDAEERAKLLIAGCTAVLNSSLADETLRDAFNAFVTRHRKTSIERLQSAIDSPQARLSDFDSASTTMQSFLRIVNRVVEPDSSLLIQCETGVGKERLARGIHAASPRSSCPFVPVILSAFPDSLVEGELFGYEKGAFTGAIRARRGCFEMAHGGTIFLDEIGELPLHIQVKLLRVLQERVIQRLGSEETIHVDVRVMAATNRDLYEETQTETFRLDLYYRLSVVTLDVPSLRHHAEDIAKLAERYLDHFRVRLNRNVLSFSDEAMRALTRYSWPGNIRELINIVERSVLMCEGKQITLGDLPRSLVAGAGNTMEPNESSSLGAMFAGDWQSRPWKDVRNAVIAMCEQNYFEQQLRKNNGNVVETANCAEIDPRSLYDLMKRHGLKKEDYREPRSRSLSHGACKEDCVTG